MPGKRVKASKAIEHQVREECGQACANPKCREWSTPTHELHHINGDRSDTTKENLILLCANCHSQQQVGVISEAEVTMWKRMAQAGALPPPKGQPAVPLMRDNYGVAGQTVHIDEVHLRQQRSSGRRAITPGLIEANPDMRTYAAYLVGRYIDWRKKGAGFDRRAFSPGAVHGILAEGFGSPSSVMLIPESRFHDWVSQAQRKIDGQPGEGSIGVEAIGIITPGRSTSPNGEANLCVDCPDGVLSRLGFAVPEVGAVAKAILWQRPQAPWADAVLVDSLIPFLVLSFGAWHAEERPRHSGTLPNGLIAHEL